MNFRTPLKAALFFSSLSFFAAACAVDGSAAKTGEDEITGSAESALPCRDCESGGGPRPGPRNPPPPPPPPVPPPAPMPASEPVGMNLCYKPFCKDLAATEALATRTLDFDGFRCENVTDEECRDERQLSLASGMATEMAVDYMRIREAFPLFSSGGVVSALCRCGCFEGSTEVLTSNTEGAVDWKAVSAVERDDRLMSLAEDASLNQPNLEAKPVMARSRGTEKPLLFAFVLDNGHTLKVTQHHGMVLDDGRVVAARDVRVGAKFVGIDGHPVAILSIERESTHDLVYNFQVDAKSNQGHVIAAEGVLVGDLAWQNHLKAELGAIHIRK
jgi:hypothetical protein